MAFKYAKLWSDGYDWRDVFRQPRDRDLIDVAEDSLTYVRVDVQSRQAPGACASSVARDLRVRRRRGSRRCRAATSAARDATTSRASPARTATASVAPKRDRNEILALLERMPSSERSRIPDVGRSATALAERCADLALALADIDRSAGGGRIRGARGGDLAPRERRESARSRAGATSACVASRSSSGSAARSPTSRRSAASIAAKLETCVVALQNIKLDLIRLNAGSQTPQHITSLAMDALNLADSVDTALYVADEMRTTARHGARPAAR